MYFQSSIGHAGLQWFAGSSQMAWSGNLGKNSLQLATGSLYQVYLYWGPWHIRMFVDTLNYI